MKTAQHKTHCDHCGTPFLPKQEERFCCHGCAYVYQTLHTEGYTRFYELKGDTTTPPVGARAFRELDASWLPPAILLAEQSGNTISESKFGVRGLSCVACVWLIESIFKAQPGAVSININTRNGSIQPRWKTGEFDAIHFAQELQKLGYELTPTPAASEQAPASRDLAQRIGLCGFFLLNTMLFTLPSYLGMAEDFFLASLFKLLAALFATLSLIVGGSYFFKRTAVALQHKVLSIDFPIALGLAVAYAGSLLGWMMGAANLLYFDFVATFVFLMLVGRWAQEFALEKNRQHLSRNNRESQHVTIYGGAEDGARKPIEQITEGDSYLLAPGEINPVSARAQTDVSLSLEWINGEPDPVTWRAKTCAPAGAINVGLTPVAFIAEEAWSQSLLAQLLAPNSDQRQERRLQRVLTTYIGIVLLVAVSGCLGWLLTGSSAIAALQVLISVLVVSCPCALGVTLPLTDELCHAKLRHQGLFIKSSDIWERLCQVKTIAFDKTGTLTLDAPQLLNPEALDGLTDEAILALYHLTNGNLHPIARSLRECLLLRHPALYRHPEKVTIRELVGRGVYYDDQCGRCWSLGKPDWSPYSSNQDKESQASTELRCHGEFVTEFYFAEDVRDDARQTIEDLQASGFSVAILSGDVDTNVARIASQLGIRDSHAQCTPGQKAEWIQQYAPGTAMMIGDGANDRLAFDHAICRGTPIIDRSLLEASADFFFFGRSLSCLPGLLKLGKQRQRAINAIFTLAIAYNFAAVTLCLMGIMHPLLAAILMPLSSIATLLVPWWFLQDR